MVGLVSTVYFSWWKFLCWLATLLLPLGVVTLVRVAIPLIIAQA